MTNTICNSLDWSEQKITNSFMFYKIFTTYPDACKELLEILLGFKIAKIEYPQGERIFNVDAEAHSVRLDIFTQDDNHIYDIEMQTTAEEDLPERARYYQGVMDTATLKPSEPYKELKDSIIIFICTFDPFKKGKVKYVFKNLDIENPKNELGDRTTKIFFNTSKYDKIQDNKELKCLLEYFNSNKADSVFTSSLERLVTTAKHNLQWRQTYMTLERFQYYASQRALKQGIQEGIEQGQQKAKESAAMSLYKNGVPLEIISKSLDMTIEKINSLLKDTMKINDKS